jgi:hypothetical protein
MRTRPELSVEMWECYDDECQCQQPKVVVRYPFHKPWPGVGIYQVISEGPFETYGYGHDDSRKARTAQERWLNEARDWYCMEPTPTTQPQGGEESK